MYLTQQSVQWIIIWVNFRNFLEGMQIRQNWSGLIFYFLSDCIEGRSWLGSQRRIIACISDLHLVIILDLFNDRCGDLLGLRASILVHNICHSITIDIIEIRHCHSTIVIIIIGVARIVVMRRFPANILLSRRVKMTRLHCFLTLTFAQKFSRLNISGWFIFKTFRMLFHISIRQALQRRHSLTMILDLTVHILWTHSTFKLMPVNKVFIFT